MFIPKSERKKALFIVDVQDWFIVERNKYIIPNIIKIVKENHYDLIVYSISYNEKDSLWFKQIGWCEEVHEDETIPELKEALVWKETIKVMKLTRSIWKWDLDLVSILKEKGIEEIHLTWYESNDCVMASALESIDLWFYTFVIEEAVETRTTAKNHTMAIEILNYLKLTNNSDYVGKSR